jgi:hypothetical protein
MWGEVKMAAKSTVTFNKHKKAKVTETGHKYTVESISCVEDAGCGDVPVSLAKEMEVKSDKDVKEALEVIKIDSKMPLVTQRKLAAKKHEMETSDLVKILAEIAKNKKQFAADRIRAVGQASKILGLDAPQQIEASFKGIMLEFSNVSSEDISAILGGG